MAILTDGAPLGFTKPWQSHGTSIFTKRIRFSR